MNPDHHTETDSTGAPLAGESVTEDQCVFGAATEHRCPKPITWRSVSSPRIGWCDEHAQDFKEGTERIAEPDSVRGAAAERKPTHRCKICGALWIRYPDSWSLFFSECGKCCDNAYMGDQLEPLPASSGEVWRTDLPRPDHMMPSLPEPNPEPIRTIYNALPADVQRKVSLHDLKRICDAVLPPAPAPDAGLPREWEATKRDLVSVLIEAREGLEMIGKLDHLVNYERAFIIKQHVTDAIEEHACPTCKGFGRVGGPVGQTPETFDYVDEPCPDCNP